MFDSGVGGLSVLECFRELCPNERVLYFADTDWFPYGPRPAAEVRKRSFAIANRLLHSDAKLIVVACNTASAAAIADLRQAFDVPFVGMVPGVKPAAQRSQSGRVVILATEGTFDGELYSRVVEEFARGTKVVAVPGAGLAELVESGEADSAAAEHALRSALAKEVAAGADTVVLGCTHYHFLAPLIGRTFPGLHVIDTSEAVARRAASVLASEGLEAPGGEKGGVDLIVSGPRAPFESVMAKLGVSRTLQEATK
jgi:glutamate racemase